jgi:hypothetical protein
MATLAHLFESGWTQIRAGVPSRSPFPRIKLILCPASG